ncbi:ankyrin repeat-containing domain protein [Astrocystis sublimbata]|nr:ankyrin repeat-containing domain protein [Astrocystis sublimbata]
MLDQFGGVNQEARSPLNLLTEGRSPLDYSAAQYDPLIFTELRSLGSYSGINAVDEEGFSVLHRLSESHIRRGRMQVSYSFLPFRGSKRHLNDQLQETVNVICELGGDLELLTSPASCLMVRGTPAYGFESRTPLMLAVEGAVPSVVEALLRAGADPNTVNERGKTALHYMSSSDADSLQHLISAGANIHHKDHNGNTVLCVPANYGNMKSVQLLLSLGADIEERVLEPSSAHYQVSIFAVLAKSGGPFDEARDTLLASCLEKYVFSQKDPERIRRVIEHNPDGRSLLNFCASRSMRLTVNTLLQHGAVVDSIATHYTKRSSSNGRIKITWKESPLDAAINCKRSLERKMRDDRMYTIPDYEDLCQRIDAIIASIIEAGGKKAPADVIESTIDDNDETPDRSRLERTKPSNAIMS